MDAVSLQVMTSALRGVAEEMQAALVRTAFSPNIKERRDCSTALFDGAGRLTVQSASIPVHLGAMPEAVAAVIERDPRPGEIWAVNDPYRGGTHLPDLTLIAPVVLDGDIAGYSVSRAHHADIGGMSPGSMPAGSRELFQEGLVIPPVALVRDGLVEDGVFSLILANTRTPKERRGDLRAQIGCHHLAQRRIEEIEARHRSCRDAFGAIFAYTERRMRAAIRGLPDGSWTAEDVLEGDGVDPADLVLRARVTIEGDEITIDFSGTASSGEGNLNCPLAVTRSAVYFVLRSLTDPDIPASAGAFSPVTIRAEEGSLVHAVSPSAVAGGNVETSSRIVDLVTRAMSGATEVPAAGQGTMNNLTIGSSQFTYYETLAGGQGGSSTGPGPTAVHVAMSNTLNTPVEALEAAYPLRVERYEVRWGSGGSGLHRGGDGVTREIRALAAAEASLITERRRHAPPGRAGGGDGALGHNSLNGEALPSKWRGALAPGDVIRIETPGGGGWGPSTEGD